MDSAVIITGASGEIGSAIAELFAEKGYNVCLCGHSKSKEGKLIEKAKELEARYHICTAVASLDVAIKEDCERVVAQFKEKFGTITTLVNSAGITDFGVFLRAKENDYHSIISSNLDGAFFMMQAVGKIMKKQRNGSIVNISSMAGIKGCPGSAVYSASKGAINSLTRTAAAELAVYGVRVNAVAPGRIEGGMSAMFADEEREMLASCSAMKRFGKPMEVASAVYFLSSSQASYITGQVLQVDGIVSITSGRNQAQGSRGLSSAQALSRTVVPVSLP